MVEFVAGLVVGWIFLKRPDLVQRGIDWVKSQLTIKIGL
jgi:hypothetical protein